MPRPKKQRRRPERRKAEPRPDGGRSRPGPGRLLAFCDRWGWLLACALCLGAFALRLWHLLAIREHDPFYGMPSVDPKVYHEWGTRLAAGEGADGVFYLSPLYPYFLGAIYSIFGPGFTVARVFQVLLSTGGCFLAFVLGKQVFDSRVGVLAALLMAIYPAAIFYDTLLLPAALQTFFMLLAVLLVHRAAERGSGLAMANGGLALGFAALARPNALVFGLVVVLWALRALEERQELRRRLILAAVFCAGVAVPIAPATWHNLRAGDDLVLISSSGGVNFFIGNGPDANGYYQIPGMFDEAEAGNPLGQQKVFRELALAQTGEDLAPSEVSSYWYGRAFDHIADQPGKWLGLLARKLGLFLNHYEIYNSRDFLTGRDYSSVLGLPLPTYGVLVPLALMGIALSFGQRRRAYFLYGALATFAVTLSLYFVLARYRLPAVPFFAVFAAFGLVRVGEWLREYRARARPLLGAAAVLALFAVVTHVEIAENEQNRWAIYYNLGNNLLAEKKYRSAIKEFVKARELAPGIISVHHNLAITYQKDPATLVEARESWQAVLRLAERRGDQMYIDRAKQHIAIVNHFLGE